MANPIKYDIVPTENETEWLWEVWTNNGYVMGTGSLTTAVKRAYYAIERGDGACIKSCTGRIIPITERRSDRPGAADLGTRTCEGYDPDAWAGGPNGRERGLQSI